MTALKDRSISNTYKDLLTVKSSTPGTGLTSTLRPLEDGGSKETPLNLSTTKISVEPSSNGTATFQVKESAGSSTLKCDTTNNEVTIGSNNEYALMNQEVFYWENNHTTTTVNKWYSMFHGATSGVLGGSSTIKNLGDDFGTGSSPEATHNTTLGDNSSSAGNYFSMFFWKLFKRIRIDSMEFHYIARYESSESAYPVVDCEVMEYTNSDGFTGSSGNFTGGTTIASNSATLTSSGLHKAQGLTIDVSQISTVTNKVLVPCVRLTTVGDYDLICKLYVNYHVY